MMIELTLVDGGRLWLFRASMIEAVGRSLDGTATMITMPAGAFGVAEAPVIVEQLINRARPGITMRASDI